MKKIFLTILLTLQPLSSHALDLSNKEHNIFGAALIFGTAYVITDDLQTSAFFALGACVGKELYDSRVKNGDGFSSQDLAADVIGISLGVVWVQKF